MRFLIAAVLTLTALSGCMVTEPSTIRDVHTGIEAGVSKEYTAAQNGYSIVRVQAMAGHQSGQAGYGLKIRRNASFSRNAFFNSAWSYGQQLTYTYGGAKVLHCAAIGCDVMEWGMVRLTPQLFNQGLQQGLELRLIGSHDNIVLSVPAEAFRQAQAVRPR